MRWIATVRERFRDTEDGQGLAEYGLILGLVAIVTVASLTTLGTAIAGSAGFSMF